MPAKTNQLQRLLAKHDACDEGRQWASQYTTAQEAWDACQNPEWMLWALDQLGEPPAAMRKLACRFVRETPLADGRKVWDLLTDERSRRAVEVVELHADGKASDEELAAASAAASAAVSAASAASAAASAAACAASAAACAASAAAWAVSAAAWAVSAAARAAAWAASAAAWAARDARGASAAQCQIIREAFPAPPLPARKRRTSP